ncbi:transposable element Tc1 transposase [Trichonephila clavipes]|nr:transposable element Tc1 transposase [Trichonephila clavipes]
MQNHRRLRRQFCDARRMWAEEWKEVFSTDEPRICRPHRDGHIRVWRHRGERMLNSCFIHCHTGPAPGIMVWGGIGYHSRTSLVRIADTLNGQRYISEVLEPVVLPYLQGLATAIFQQDNALPHVARIVQSFFVNHQIELFLWPARSPDLSPIDNMWFMVAQRLTQITPPAATPDQLWQRMEAASSAVPLEHIQKLFESMPRRVSAVIINNGGNYVYLFWQEIHFTEVYKFNHLILGQHVIHKIYFVVLTLVFLSVAFTVASCVYQPDIADFDQRF